MAEFPAAVVPPITFTKLGADIDDITKTSALIGYKDGNNVQVSLLSRYCENPVVAAKKICNAINPVTDGAIRNLLAATYATDQNLEDSPESIPDGKVLKFRCWFAGQDPDVDIPVTLNQFIPFAVFQDAEEYTTVGEAIQAALAVDGAFEQVDFIKPRRR